MQCISLLVKFSTSFMKKLNLHQLRNIFAAVLIVFLIIKSMAHHSAAPANMANGWYNNVKPIDASIPETLPYNQYIKLKDSIATIRNLKNGDVFEFDGLRIGGIGVFKNLSCDTCSLKWYNAYAFNDSRFEQNYVKLYDWKLGIDETLRYVDDSKFYADHGQGYVRRAIIDTALNRKDGSLYNKISIKDIPVKFRYSHKDKCLMIPINSSTAQLLKITGRVLMILVIIYILFLIRTFLIFIVDLSKSRAFTNKNIFRLKLIAVSLLTYPVLMFVLSYIFRIIFNTYFIKNVVFINDVWNSTSLIILGTGSVFLLLYNAFRQGKILKEEQDLTV
ncbi:MAG: hypothetical protein JWQ79_1289 [Mucilaginibacter sp.]|nr:hypothetical protein [Mucilaginibacter sp.]